MKTIERIKKECEIKGLDFETVIYNMSDIEQYRYKKGKLYFSKTFVNGKFSFSQGLCKEDALEYYV